MAKRKVLSRSLPDATLPRNSFDRGFTAAYTYACGQLLPVFCQPVIAGSHSKINRRIFQRTANVHTAAFATLDTHIQFYFVPMRQLYTTWDDFKLNIQDVNSSLYRSSAVSPVNTGVVPYFNLKNLKNAFNNNTDTDILGYKAHEGALRLLDMLGYGNFETTPDNDFRSIQLNCLRLLAYQKVYFDHFRNTAYETNDPFYYNADWDIINNSGNCQGHIRKMLTLHYVNYRKDYFQNVYPSLNYTLSTPSGSDWAIPKSIVGDNHGDSSEVGFESTFAGDTGSDYQNYQIREDSSSVPTTTTFGSSNGDLQLTSQGFDIYGVGNPVHTHGFEGYGEGTIQGQYIVGLMNAQTIRATFALDKLMRASAYAPKHAKDQYEARYGIKFPVNPNESVFLGSFKNDVVIGEVVNSADTVSGDNGLPLGAIGGKGVGVGQFEKDIVYDNKEDGFIIGVQYTLPRTSYNSSRIDAYNMKSDREDFFIPEFMDMGLQPLIRREMKLQSNNIQDNYILGYVPRYQEYKIGIDENHGLFALTSSLNKFVVDSSSKLDSNVNVDENGVKVGFFKVAPSDVDSIFQVAFDGSQSTDQFLNYTHFKFDCVMNMSVHGQPRL